VRPILTPEQSAELDRASGERGVTVDSLMERAGRAVARAASTAGVYGRRVVAVCGKGNNGGDGLVAARYLRRWGMGATAVLLAEQEAFQGAAAVNLERARSAGVRIVGQEALGRELDRADVALDAMVGTGFRGVPKGAVRDAIDAVNEVPFLIVAVDIASGVDGATGAIAGPAVDADVTVTFGTLKPGHVFYPGAGHAGEVEVADIGFPDDLLTSDVLQVERLDVLLGLPHRPPDSHKRSTGVVLVVGGSRDMTGAVRLMAGAALRAGAGLVQVAVPEGILPVVQTGLVEATFLPLPETTGGAIAAGAVDVLKERLTGVDAVAVGPGLGRDEETLAFVRALVAASPVPTVVDADGLTAFGGRLEELGDAADLVLTPHSGEFSRLSGIPVDEVNAERIGNVRALAEQLGGTVLLKGNPTVIGLAGGEVRVNSTGGPSLATGGTGDVLTGIIAAMLARGVPPDEAATAGAFVHGRAGDLAGALLGEGATSLDVQAHVPAAIRSVLEPG
jgi:NAD(P)H-hydrate epimerase